MEKVLTRTQIPNWKVFSRGKVKDTFSLPKRLNGVGGNSKLLLMVTTDRLSALDVTMTEGVPDIGKIRNTVSLWWFKRLRQIMANHIFLDKQTLCAGLVPEKSQERNDLVGRCAVVYEAEVYPIECVVRGYLYGSAWESYQRNGTICGIKLQPGLKEAERLSFPIFTPTTKAKTGHDEPIDFDALVQMVGGETAEFLRQKSLELYIEADAVLALRNLIIADTKFEFGIVRKGIDQKTILLDELLTPDSSRYWDGREYKPGGSQPSFDKQPVRDWLKASGWDGISPPPVLPEEVAAATRNRYAELYSRLTGQSWPPQFSLMQTFSSLF